MRSGLCQVTLPPASTPILYAPEALLLDPETTHFLTWCSAVSPWSLGGNVPPDVQKTWMASALMGGKGDM